VPQFYKWLNKYFSEKYRDTELKPVLLILYSLRSVRQNDTYECKFFWGISASGRVLAFNYAHPAVKYATIKREFENKIITATIYNAWKVVLNIKSMSLFYIRTLMKYRHITRQGKSSRVYKITNRKNPIGVRIAGLGSRQMIVSVRNVLQRSCVWWELRFQVPLRYASTCKITGRRFAT
jgi:hypothetical protein